MKPSHDYMYATANEEIEETRLAGLNALHNPYTLKFLHPFLSGRRKILEVGCGAGYLAAEVLRIADIGAEYTGVDRDPAQVNLCNKSLNQFSNARVMQLDIVTEFEKLKSEGPFDLIYCRWVLVHLPSSVRINVIRNLLSLLSNNGVFLCDECDNRSVKFKSIRDKDAATALYSKATQLWSTISKGLMKLLGNDLEYAPEKIKMDLLTAGKGRGEVNVEGQYQIVLRQRDQKKLITDGYRSSHKIVSQVCEKPFEEIIAVFDKCIEDESIVVEFLTENVVTYRVLPKKP